VKQTEVVKFYISFMCETNRSC